jgi:hypothetical protein
MNSRMALRNFPYGHQSCSDFANAYVPAFREVVFPNPDDAPTASPKDLIHLEISGLVFGKLSLPEAPVICRHLRVFGAAVPEATVHKDRYPGLSEYKVRFSEYGLVASPAGDLVASQQFHQGEFCLLVAASANSGHYIGAFCLREDVSHHSS